LRTFIAINLNPELKETLSNLIEELKRLDPARKSVRWVNQQAMHLTLKFLGEIDESQVEQIKKALEQISDGSRTFTMEIRGTGYFPPDKRNPRVLWLGIEEEKSLQILQSRLEEEMEKLGFPKENRKFHPHLTLGRVKIPSNLREIMLHLEQYGSQKFGEMEVRKITFFKSVLKPTGAEYSVLSEFELK
jgi:2'-5' RNA ligase